jgi:hypothetical protein
MVSPIDKPQGGFKVESNPTYLNFQKVEVTKVDDAKPWKPPLEVKVTKADGSVEEGVDATTPFFTLKDADLRELTVSAAAAGHVDSLHIKGTDPGSKFDYSSLEAMLVDAEDKLPDHIFDNPNAPSAFDIEMGKNMGSEGLANTSELTADGTITAEDVATLQTVKNEVAEANKSGTPESRQAVVDKFNTEHPDCKIQLQVIRGGAVIVPTVSAPKRPTTKLFMVFGPDGKGGKTLWTAAPGRNMPRHPIPAQFNELEGGVEGAAFQESLDAWFNTVMLTK